MPSAPTAAGLRHFQCATTPREIAYVREHFCAELASRYAKLADEDKESLKHYGVTYHYGGKQDHGMLGG
jgi:hypothetical protein